jgi:hypothetical protein
MPTVLDTSGRGVRLRTGPVEVALRDGALAVTRPGSEGSLRVRPGGAALGALDAEAVTAVDVAAEGEVEAAVESDLGWAEATVRVRVPADEPGVLAYRLDLDPSEPRTVAGGPELAVDGDHRDYLAGRPGTEPAGGTGDLTQFQFLGLPALDATALYAPDFSALGEYFAATDTSMHDTVAAPPGEFGFAAPEGELSGDAPVAAGVLAFEEGVPGMAESVAYCRRFVDTLPAVVDCLDTPDPERVDWPAVAERTATDLAHPANRHEYRDVWHPGGVEAVSMLSVVNPFRRYTEQFDADPAAMPLPESPEAAIDAYHDPTFETASGSRGVVANTPAPADLSLVDAWYFLWPVVQTAEYARETGSEAATEAALDAADAAIDIARAVDYVFPMWLDVAHLEPAALDETEWSGYQYDCTGAYVYLLCQFHDLTGEQRYLAEAERAADRLLEMGFEYAYEFTTTALGPVALAWLADLTGERRYREGVAVPLANVLRYAYYFEPDAGEFAGRRVYGLHAAMPADDYTGNYYANALEEDAVVEYLGRLLDRSYDDLDSGVRGLVADLLAAKGTSLADSLPDRHDPEMVETGVAPQSGRRVNPEWALPLEPFGALGPDYDRLGATGQTLYGAGAYPTMATVQYHPLWGDLTLYTPTPAEVERLDEHAVEVRPLAEGAVEAALLGAVVDAMDVAVRHADGSPVPTANADRAAYRVELTGGERYRISREVPHRNMVVESLTAPSRVAPGDPIEVTATVRNTGTHSGHYEVTVEVGAEELTEWVVLDAGETATVTVETSREVPGEYGVRAVRQRRRVVVE